MARRFFPDGDPIGARMSWPDSSAQGAGDDSRGGRQRRDQRPRARRNTGGIRAVHSAGAAVPPMDDVRRPDRSIIRGQLRSRCAPPCRPSIRASRSTRCGRWRRSSRESLAERRFSLLLMAAFAALTVGLAMLGLYGMLAQRVERRRREIGVRMSLGASSTGVFALVLRQGRRRRRGWSGAGHRGEFRVGRTRGIAGLRDHAWRRSRADRGRGTDLWRSGRSPASFPLAGRHGSIRSWRCETSREGQPTSELRRPSSDRYGLAKSAYEVAQVRRAFRHDREDASSRCRFNAGAGGQFGSIARAISPQHPPRRRHRRRSPDHSAPDGRDERWPRRQRRRRWPAPRRQPEPAPATQADSPPRNGGPTISVGPHDDSGGELSRTQRYQKARGAHLARPSRSDGRLQPTSHPAIPQPLPQDCQHRPERSRRPAARPPRPGRFLHDSRVAGHDPSGISS